MNGDGIAKSGPLTYARSVRFFVAVAVLFAATLSAFAQASADDEYLLIYNVIEQADANQKAGDVSAALSEYTEVQNRLRAFQSTYPDWNPKVVHFRLEYAADQIAALAPQLPPTNAVAAPAGVSSNTVAAGEAAAWRAQLASLQQELRSAQADNSTLAAKLKEALSAQPASVDPRELARAQEQVRSLMKENDLLKASLGQGSKGAGPATNNYADLQAALAQASQKLADALARENKLTLEKQALAARVQALMSSPSALQALRDENALLKKQLAELQASATNSDSVAELQRRLADARLQVTLLRSNNEVMSLERLALQNRVQLLESRTNAAGSQKEFNDRLRSLTNERDDLLAKLDAANRRLYGGKKEDAIARIDQLSDEVNRLRARLSIAEAQPVPFTAEEAALMKPSRLAANPNAEKKGLSEMPDGSAGLVAEAQRNFSAGNYDAAEEDYLKILRRDQNNGLALANLATIELQQNKLADAEKHITTALAASPDDAYNLLVLGEVKFGQGQYDEALDALGRAAKADPQNPQIENVIGATLAQKGLRAQAETAFRKAIQLDPKYADAHKNLAVIYLSQQPPMVALARWHYQKALDAGMPRNPGLEKMLADKSAGTSP